MYRIYTYHPKHTQKRLKVKETFPSNSPVLVHIPAFNCRRIDTALQEINEFPLLKDELIKDE